MKKNAKTLICTWVLLMLGISLSACANTAEGFGRDLERAGQTIQKKV
jgi:predicted small secreted protein